MRTFEDEITIAIAVDLAVLKPHQRRAIAGLDQSRPAVEVRGVPALAAKIADSLAPYAIFGGQLEIEAIEIRVLAAFLAIEPFHPAVKVRMLAPVVERCVASSTSKSTGAAGGSRSVQAYMSSPMIFSFRCSVPKDAARKAGRHRPPP